MRDAGWTPSIVPNDGDQNVYIVLDDFGRNGCAYRETDVDRTDLEAVIMDMLEGQCENPVRVVGFNRREMVTRRLGRRRPRASPALRLQLRDVPFYLEEFVERYEGRYHDVQLPLPIPLT